jgi:hypothetical protein
MRIRQAVLAARDLEPVLDDLCAVLGVQVCYRDPNVGIFGIKNAVMPIGDAFLEVVSPVQADAAAARYLDRRGGDCGYMVIVQCDDLEADRKRVADLGVRVVWSIDLPEISATHLHPRDVGGAILSLDASRPPESWLWAGREWEAAVRTEVTEAIAGVEIAAEHHAALAKKWSQVLDRPLSPSSKGNLRMALDRDFIDFEKTLAKQGEGLSGLVVKVADRERLLSTARERNLTVRDDAIEICGTRVRLTSS